MNQLLALVGLQESVAVEGDDEITELIVDVALAGLVDKLPELVVQPFCLILQIGLLLHVELSAVSLHG